MSSLTCEKVLADARQLSLADQLLLLEKVACLVRRRTSSERRRSVLELQGLGKEIWRDIDARKYVDEERSSWDG